MQRNFSLLSLLLLMPITNVLAVEWTSIIKDAEHEVLVDIDSYNVSDNHPYLDAKTVYQTPQIFTLPDDKVEYFTGLAKYQFNCKKPLFRMRTITLMSKKNIPIDTIRISSGYQKLVMDTDEFSIGQLTCQVHQMLGG
tara:strand:- start:5621 stop:6034 length:414 start_codon:yes stop_codon:yes gene_type:complete